MTGEHQENRPGNPEPGRDKIRYRLHASIQAAARLAGNPDPETVNRELGRIMRHDNGDGSWDASFNGLHWNYTHNINSMIREAYDIAVQEHSAPDAPSWWRRLNGLTGPEGANYLGLIIEVLEADPVRFRAMNPVNGRGDYDSLLVALRAMRAACYAPQCCAHECPNPERWSVSG